MTKYQNSRDSASISSSGGKILYGLSEARGEWPDAPPVKVSDLAPPPPPAKINALKSRRYTTTPDECGFRGVCECTADECQCCGLPGERIICQGLEWSLSTHGIYHPRWAYWIKRETVPSKPEDIAFFVQHYREKPGVDWRELGEMIAIGLRVWPPDPEKEASGCRGNRRRS
jgi:hypothetical protein